MKYSVFLNNGNENLGVTEKTITVNEVCETISIKFLSEECHHENPLVPVQVIESVLTNFGRTAARLMAEGFALQFKDGNDVLMRIYPDIHIKGGNINLARAQELDPEVTELTLENAGDLVSKAGVTVRAKAECETKFTELLMDNKPSIQRKEVVEKAKVLKKEGTSDSGSDTTGNSNNNNEPPSGGNVGD